MIHAVLGIDTSCYTTSVALASGGRVVASERKLLEVKAGERGLRQSDGVFQHVTALSELMRRLFEAAPEYEVAAVCASARPRDADGSYMPVFTVGSGAAKQIAAAARVPYYETSHQKGHVRAAMVDSGIDMGGAFMALHLSGGTTEVLYVDEKLNIQLLGGSSDLHAGQFVDRVGVRLGLGFPCGPALEALAVNGEAKGLIPLSHKDGTCSFSGAEAQVMRIIESGELSAEDVAAEVYSYLSRAVARLIYDSQKECGASRALLAGGVASSRLLRTLLPARLKRLGCECEIHWARPELAGDNACGVALLGYQIYEGGNTNGSSN